MCEKEGKGELRVATPTLSQRCVRHSELHKPQLPAFIHQSKWARAARQSESSLAIVWPMSQLGEWWEWRGKLGSSMG